MCLQRARGQNWCSLEATELACKMRASLPGEYLTLPPTASQMYFPEVWGRGAGSTFTVTE
jgi:uncharacterized protein YfaS (alpha-2-macroglobulin family)